MESFFGLPIDKQNKIIDAALKSFGTNGYKKSSISDIAISAGISKAMVFHYFGTKKALYLYLINYCVALVMKVLSAQFDNTVTDFFDRIMLATKIEISLMKKHPAILNFLTSVYFETDSEVKDDIKANLAASEDFRKKIALEGMDITKFKDGVDPKLVLKMLTLLAEGFTRQMSDTDFDKLFEELKEYMNLLKNNLYKEVYLR